MLESLVTHTPVSRRSSVFPLYSDPVICLLCPKGLALPSLCPPSSFRLFSPRSRWRTPKNVLLRRLARCSWTPRSSFSSLEAPSPSSSHNPPSNRSLTPLSIPPSGRRNKRDGGSLWRFRAVLLERAAAGNDWFRPHHYSATEVLPRSLVKSA